MQASDIFKALSDQNRIKILQILNEKEKMSVGNIKNRLKITQPLVSHHLKALKKGGIVKSSVQGQQRIYTISSPKIIFLIKQAEDIVKILKGGKK
jgi:DNA-binding transcriptional ArsR family regulator